MAAGLEFQAPLIARIRERIDEASSVEPDSQPPPDAPAPVATATVAHSTPSVSSSLWVMLLARIYEVFPLVCRNCGQEMRIIAFF